MVSICQFMVVFCFCQIHVTATSIEIPSSASVVDGQTEYILFTYDQTWNTARKVCTAYGARLATIDSQAKLDLIEELSNGVWRSNWDDVWTGLHRESDNSLRYDDDHCSLFNADYSGTDIFRSYSHYDGTYDYDEDLMEKCFKIDNIEFKLDLRPCNLRYQFICEKQATGQCKYASYDSGSLVIPLVESSAPVCQSLCDQQSGCYLAANSSSYCVLLSVPGTDSSVYTKDCTTASIRTLDTTHLRGSDNSYQTATACTTNKATMVAPLTSGQVNIDVLMAQAICPSQETVTIDCSVDYTTVTSLPSTVTSIQATSLILTSTVTQYVTVPETVSDVLTITASCLSPTATVTETVNNNVIQTESCVDGVSGFSRLTTTETLTSTEIYNTCSVQSTLTPPLMTSTATTATVAQGPIDISVSTGHFIPISATSFSSVEPSIYETFAGTELVMASSVALYYNVTSRLKQTTICKTYNLTGFDTAQVEAAMSSIVKELTLETKNLSSSIRKKTSAQDARKSSSGIGYSAIGTMAVPFILLLLLDTRKMFRDLRYTASGPRQQFLP